MLRISWIWLIPQVFLVSLVEYFFDEYSHLRLRQELIIIFIESVKKLIELAWLVVFSPLLFDNLRNFLNESFCFLPI